MQHDMALIRQNKNKISLDAKNRFKTVNRTQTITTGGEKLNSLADVF